MENMAFEKIENAIHAYQENQVKNPFFKFIIVDLDDVTIIIQRMGMKLKKMLMDAKI